MTQRPFLQLKRLKKGVQNMHKARVKVTFNPEASEAIRRLSKASGESMSSVISSLFDPCVSELNHMANLIEHAGQLRDGMPENSRQFFRSIMNQMRNDMEPKPGPTTTRIDTSRATPKERFYAETKRLEALKQTGLDNDMSNPDGFSSAVKDSFKSFDSEIVDSKNWGADYD